MGALTRLPTHLALTGFILLSLGAVHVLLPRTLQWSNELGGVSRLNREVSYVHCYFIGLVCMLWGLLPLTAGPAMLEPSPVTRLVLLGAVIFWGSRLVIQLTVFNHHARDSRAWFALSFAGTALWLYLTVVWTAAFVAQL